MDLKRMFLTFDGRIGIKDFWIGILILIGANVVAGFIPFVGLLISLFLIYCGICLYANRLHDFGKSGWLQLVPLVINVVLWGAAFVVGGAGLFAAIASGEDPAAAASVLAGAGLALLLIAATFLVSLAFLLWVGLSKGDPGPNRYGPPLGAASASTEVAPTPAS